MFVAVAVMADYPAATMFTAAMNRVQQVPFVKLNAGDTANAWSAALPAALTWLWQQLARARPAGPVPRVASPTRPGAEGVKSTVVGVIGGFEQRGDSPGVSYAAALRAAAGLYQNAEANG